MQATSEAHDHKIATPFATSAGKMLAVLMALGDLGLRCRGGIRLMDLVAATGLPRPTVHRLLGELKRSGFAEQDDGGQYRLGHKVILLSAQCLGGFDLRREAHAYLQAFAEDIGHTVHLGIRDGVQVVYLDKIEPSHGLHVSSSIGERRPLSTTAMGKVLLAYSERTILDQVLTGKLNRMTAKSIIDPAELASSLESVRARGFAIDDEESTLGVRCASAPVFDAAGAVIAAISISTIKSQVSLRCVEELGQQISLVANTITQALSGTQKPPLRIASGSGTV